MSAISKSVVLQKSDNVLKSVREDIAVSGIFTCTNVQVLYNAYIITYRNNPNYYPLYISVFMLYVT